MTSPFPGDDPAPDASRPAAPDADGEPDELPPDLEGFLVRLGKSVQRHGLYPAGHPALEPVVGDVLEDLARALDGRDRISLGVSPDRLVHEEGESDPDHPLLSSLAARLHAHHVSRLTFRPDPEHEEISAFLGELARSPDDGDDALGRRRELTDEWPRILVEPVRYDGLSMAEEAAREEAAREEIEEEAEDLWLGLARSVLAEEALEDVDEDEAALDTVVASLSEVTADRARARAVAARMVALAEALARDRDDDADRVQERFVHLLQRLDPRDLGRVLATAPADLRQSFVEATVDWLPADSVVELLGELSDGRNLDVSYHMLRLLSKLASYADLEADALDPEAGSAFREQVKRLVTGWRENIAVEGTGEDAAEMPAPEPAAAPESGEDGAEQAASGRAPAPAPGRGAGGSTGPGAPRQGPPLTGPGAPVLPEQRSFVDPGRVIRTALEAGALGPVGREAVEEMIREHRTEELLDVLRDGPESDALAEAWEAVDESAAVRQLLARSPPDFEALDALMERRGGVAGPLLDVLSESQSRSVRRKLFSRLAEMEGEDVTEAVLERLGDERWFVKRNMLALLGERGDPPDRFAPLPYTRHSRAEVRKEAYKLAFRSASDRVEAVRRALGDPDRKALSLGMGALRSMPVEVVDEVVPQLRERLEEDDLPPRLARQAVRELGRSESEAALEALLELCRQRSVWRFWTVDLAEKSTVVVEAIEAIARSWGDHPEARPVLERAREADDPEIREAVRAGAEVA